MERCYFYKKILHFDIMKLLLVTFLSKMPGESSILMKFPLQRPKETLNGLGSKSCTWQKVLRIRFYISVPTFSSIRENFFPRFFLGSRKESGKLKMPGSARNSAQGWVGELPEGLPKGCRWIGGLLVPQTGYPVCRPSARMPPRISLGRKMPFFPGP